MNLFLSLIASPALKTLSPTFISVILQFSVGNDAIIQCNYTVRQ